MSYKLIACDLDGTLVGEDSILSKENYSAIKELTAKGIYFVPATGRTISQMRNIFDLPEIRYVIFSNGAALLDKKTGEKIFCGLDKQLAEFVFDTLSKYDVYMVVSKDGNVYADMEKRADLQKYNVCNVVTDLIDKVCVKDREFSTDFLSQGGTEMISVFFKTGGDMEACRNSLLKNPGLNTTYCWDFNLEIFSKSAGKANALQLLADKLGISMQETMSIGDSDNDMKMIQSAGLGLATENACEALKAVADRVICSNCENVVEFVNENYFSH